MSAFLLRHGVSAPIQAMTPWMQALVLNQWTNPSVVNTLGDVVAPNTGQYGNSGPDAIMDAWCSDVYIPTFGQYGSIVRAACGGHQDYYGNEGYAFDLGTLTHTRLNNPSVQANWNATFTNGLTDDGKPTAIHGYYYNFHRNGKFGSAKRQTDNLPNAVYSVSLFDPGPKTWQISTQTPATLNPSNDEGVCYDPDRDVLWIVEVNPLQWARYSFALDQWTTFTEPTGALQPQCGPAYCQGIQAVVQFVDDAIWGLDPQDPAHEKYVISTTGTGPTRGTGDCPRWSNNLGAICYFPSKSNSIYLLTPPAGNWRSGTWVWSQISTTSTTGTHTGNGTYGKFQIIEKGSATIAAVVGGPAQPYRFCRIS